jgi:GDP-4-dehydro-6-deoxy-D-mannose reductase
MNILVTGGTGFIGRNLLEQFPDDNVFCGVRHNTLNELSFKPPKNCEFLYFPLNNKAIIKQNLNLYKIDVIYHLAAKTSVFESFKVPYEYFDVNINNTLNLIQAITESDRKNIKLIFASSAELYKPSYDYLYETYELEPKNPYALSKYFIDNYIRMNAKNIGLNAIIVRQFNCIGPGQADKFVMSSFAKQVAEIKLNKRDRKITVGNIGVSRDFSDVRDVVRAYKLLNDSKLKPGEAYNICSSSPKKISLCLDIMLKSAGLTDVEVEIDKSRFRPNDLQYMCGSYKKIKLLGWMPEIKIERTLSDMVKFWEEKLR